MNSPETQAEPSPRAEAPIPALAPATPKPPDGALTLLIAEYGIGMVIPPSAEFAGTLNLNCGVVIYGSFKGVLECSKGAVVVPEGGKFTGKMTADRIVIAGKIGDASVAAKDSALIIAGESLHLGATADVQGVLRTPCLVNPDRSAKLNSSIIKSMLTGG
ncbi:bactofilin family protein [Variovorax gossypii]|uniref:bactofilin family protein n=1 Tax=uncultured Variovorax sp. TaxID=114708 RepID=UPI00260D6F16|nr:polymer-forming cytoskeletal protein [uncultured Variovorax sp.]